MGFEVYIWIILMMLILTALGAKVLTTRLLGMQKRRYVTLQAKKQGLAQRQVAVHKRLESLRNTREMMARRKDRLSDEVAQLRSEAGDVDDLALDTVSDVGDESELGAEEERDQEEVEVVAETSEEPDSELPADDPNDPDSRQIRTHHDRSGSLFEEDKPREIKTYLDKIRDAQTKDDET